MIDLLIRTALERVDPRQNIGKHHVYHGHDCCQRPSGPGIIKPMQKFPSPFVGFSYSSGRTVPCSDRVWLGEGLVAGNMGALR
jgi:hypothetical protein